MLLLIPQHQLELATQDFLCPNEPEVEPNLQEATGCPEPPGFPPATPSDFKHILRSPPLRKRPPTFFTRLLLASRPFQARHVGKPRGKCPRGASGQSRSHAEDVISYIFEEGMLGDAYRVALVAVVKV